MTWGKAAVGFLSKSVNTRLEKNELAHERILVWLEAQAPLITRLETIEKADKNHARRGQ